MNIIVQDFQRSVFGLIDMDEARWNYVFDWSVVVCEAWVGFHFFFCGIAGVVAEDVGEDLNSRGSSPSQSSAPHAIHQFLPTSRSNTYTSLSSFSVSGYTSRFTNSVSLKLPPIVGLS